MTRTCYSASETICLLKQSHPAIQRKQSHNFYQYPAKCTERMQNYATLPSSGHLQHHRNLFLLTSSFISWSDVLSVRIINRLNRIGKTLSVITKAQQSDLCFLNKETGCSTYKRNSKLHNNVFSPENFPSCPQASVIIPIVPLCLSFLLPSTLRHRKVDRRHM